ncbi:rop guanine nucleotide exchange factor 3 [Olea europaea subsp. europaea]|uniref:Rop guanine nucleotide exchange factor 3 n=1 Tax=Olea europaea subsp. europaea TaxID=158383 RepID=A0A8S0RW07_OLEEU|nr:rop guanine nucleotide exchange factor 3 [Olea europaea subsp. europaea]
MSGSGKGVCTAVTISNAITNLYDSFEKTEFWYAEQGSISGNSTRSGSFRKMVLSQGKEEKRWLPAPCVSSPGLSEKSKMHLRQKGSCANQIHKAAMAINSCILAGMEIPESYMPSLPKVEASMHTWRRNACLAHSKSSWDMVKDLMSDIDRSDNNHILAKRAENLLFYLKQRYPELSQTTLDTCKIQYNKASFYLIQIKHLEI